MSESGEAEVARQRLPPRTRGAHQKQPGYGIHRRRRCASSAPEQTVDLTVVKPVLRVSQTAGGVLVQWTKKGLDGVELHVDRGRASAFWRLIRCRITDTQALPAAGQSALWKYKGGLSARRRTGRTIGVMWWKPRRGGLTVQNGFPQRVEGRRSGRILPSQPSGLRGNNLAAARWLTRGAVCEIQPNMPIVLGGGFRRMIHHAHGHYRH